jgi:hypothetical protein
MEHLDYAIMGIMAIVFFGIITAYVGWNFPSKINSRIERSLGTIRLEDRGRGPSYIVHTNKLRRFNTSYPLIVFTIIGTIFMLTTILIPLWENEDVDTGFVDIMAVLAFVVVFIIPMGLMASMLISHTKILFIDKRGIEVWTAKKDITYSLGSVKWSDVSHIEIRATNSMTGGDHLMWMYTTDGNIRVWLRWDNILPLLEHLERFVPEAIEASNWRTKDVFEYYRQTLSDKSIQPASM